MVDKKELLDRIEDMEEAHEETVARHKREINKFISEFQTILRNLHDYTFTPLEAEERLRYVRMEIEKQLEKWVDMYERG